MQQKSQHTYGKMNKDLSKNKYAPEVYYEGKNIYIVSENKQSTGAVSNIKGTTLLYEIPDISPTFNDLFTFTYLVDSQIKSYTTNQDLPAFFFPVLDMRIIGIEPLLEDLIIFTTNSSSLSPSSIGCVWKVSFKGPTSLTLLYMNVLDFSSEYPIEAECRYETETIQKVYWTDRYNELRFLNLSDPDLPNLPLDFVDVVPTYAVGQIVLDGTLSGGNFTAGMVGWGYSLSNFNGQESKISPVSKLYNVNRFDNGVAVNDTVGRSFRVRIDNIDTRFDLINIYRLFYTSLNAEPQITLAARENVTGVTAYWIDDYNTIIRTLSTAEFIAYGTEPFVSGTIATKNEYLFSDENTYKFFDFDYDARAYRFAFINDFQQPRRALIFDRTGALEANIDGAAPVWPIDTELDAINKSNAANTLKNMNESGGFYGGVENPDYNRFKFQSNGIIRGGTGPNIEYKFVTQPTITDSAGNANSIVGFDSNTSLLNPLQQTLTGFKRDEIYRMGIVFFNNRGQQSFVKWIGDIRIPPVNELPISGDNAGSVEMLQVQIEFTMLNQPTSRTDIVGYQYVRVERTVFESTIIAQGIVNSFCYDQNTPNQAYYGGKNQPICAVDGYHTGFNVDGNDDEPSAIYPNGGIMDGYSSFASARNQPSFADKILYQRTANLGGSGDFNSNYEYRAAQFLSNEIDEFTPPDGYFNIVGLPAITKQRTIRYPNGLDSPFAYDYATVGGMYTDGTTGYAQVYEVFTKAGNTPRDGSGLVLDLDIIRIQPEDTLYVAEREKQRIKSMRFANNATFDFLAAGGFEADNKPNNNAEENGDVQFNNNRYIAFLLTSDPNKGLDTALWDGSDGLRAPDFTPRYVVADYKRELFNQYGGQTYVARTRNQYIPSSPFVPLATSVVNSWGDVWVSYQVYNYGEMFDRTNFTTLSSLRFTIQVPTENRIRYDLLKTDFLRFRVPFAAFEETVDYNTVYSQDYDLIGQITRPLNWLENATFIAETAYSDPKLNGEEVDSWTVWRAGNRKPLDAKWGRCVALVENRDILFFFQERGVGYWDVQPYKQTVTTDGSLIQLGTGGVLERRNYISTNQGCQHKFSIGKSTYGVMWYDQHNKAIRLLQSGIEEVSTIKGLSVELYNLPLYDDKPTAADGITTVYDADRLQMLMTFRKLTKPIDEPFDDYTVAYSFLNTGFVTELDVYPRLSRLGFRDTYMASNNGRELYTFGRGNRGEFFGNVVESSITVIINSVPEVVKLLTNLQWNSEAYDINGAHLHDKTVSHVEIWNDYQSTGKVDVTQMDFNQFKRLMRNWLFKVPFDASDEMNRIRSQYFFVKLYFDNTENHEYILHDLIATFILQPL